MDAEEYLVEELFSNDVPESELSQFKETQPLEVVGILMPENAGNSSVQRMGEMGEGALIKKFVCGEVEFPDCYTKLEPEDEEDEQVETEAAEAAAATAAAAADKKKRHRLNFAKHVDPLDDIDMLPSTSKQAAATAAKSSGARRQSAMVVDTTLGEFGTRQRIGGGAAGGSTGGGARRRNVLNAALQGLMGEANLSFARGQIQIAEKICLEIIRQNPLAPEPFFTLAEIYETRDTEKYLNFLTIAAHLNPHDRDQWVRIAEMHIAQGNLQRARVYYTKAIKVLPRDYDLRLRKARLLELMGETQLAMFTYLKMIPHIPSELADLCLMTAKNVARHFHGISKHEQALEAMEHAYAVCGNRFSIEDLNLYMELLILNKAYARVLRCLRDHTDLQLETEQENNLELVFFCVIPDDYVPDFRTKLCVSLIHLHAHHLLGYLIQNVHQHIPVEGDRLDMYIDIAEALMQEHKYAEAIELLRPITDCDSTECPAFVWLRHAECLRHLNRTNEAIESYSRVVEMAPFCYEAKFTLSALLKQQGRHVEAAKALEQSGECEGQPMNARLLYERCVMLKQIGEVDEFLEVGYVLLARQSLKLRNREEMLAAANGGSFYNAEGLKVILQMRNITEDTDKALQEYFKPQQEDTDLSIHEEYRLFLELIRTSFNCGKFSYIERICFAMVTTKRFVAYHLELERIIILACYFNNDCTIAFSYLREVISKNPNSIPLWNLLSLLVQKGQEMRYHRYVRRLVQRHHSVRQQRIFIAHYHLHCSSYKYALNTYMPIYKEQKQPLVALCIAVVFNQMSLQRKVLRKCAAVAQSVAFAKQYAKLRAGEHAIDDVAINYGKVDESADAASSSKSVTKKNTDAVQCSATQQEIYYNIGRIYHQSGMTHLAVEYYERALSVRHPLIEENEEYLGLRPEIAYNLHLIYRAAGNMLKARHYLYQYCVV